MGDEEVPYEDEVYDEEGEGGGEEFEGGEATEEVSVGQRRRCQITCWRLAGAPLHCALPLESSPLRVEAVMAGYGASCIALAGSDALSAAQACLSCLLQKHDPCRGSVPERAPRPRAALPGAYHRTLKL